MGRFLKKILRFLLLALLVWTLLLVVSLLSLPEHRKLQHSGVTMRQDCIPILGNSHPECAINDTMLGGRFINLAHTAEPLFYTAVKARLLIKHLHADTIIIEYGNKAFQSNHWIFPDNRCFEMYREYVLHMQSGEHMAVWEGNPVKAVKVMLSVSPVFIYRYYNRISGGYLALDNTLDSQTLPQHYPTDLEDTAAYRPEMGDEQFLINQRALESLVSSNPGVHFVLVRLPFHRAYRHFNEGQFRYYLSRMLKYRNVRFVDFHRSMTVPVRYLADLEHLNRRGAAWFTPVFADSMRRLGLNGR